MVVSSVTTAGVVSAVWTNATRTLTSVAANYTAVSAVATSVPAAATADTRPAAGKFRELSWGVDNSTSEQAGLYNGTTFTNLTTQAVATSLNAFNTSAFCFTYHNADVAAHNISFCGWDIA